MTRRRLNKLKLIRRTEPFKEFFFVSHFTRILYNKSQSIQNVQYVLKISTLFAIGYTSKSTCIYSII